MANSFSYTPIDSKGGQIRLLSIKFDVKHNFGHSNINPIVGSLKSYYLPLSTLPRAARLGLSARLPTYIALSYVWGNPERSHEILIDGKTHRITENLYNGLRTLQRQSYGELKVWADAICINQDDLAERSAQVLLMREIYHSSCEVNVWLGPSTSAGLKCSKFIADLTGGFGYEADPDPGSEVMGRTKEIITKTTLTPFYATIRAGIGFGAKLILLAEAASPSTLDDKATIIQESDRELSLTQEAILKYSKWRPSGWRLEELKDVDFEDMARSIDEVLIQQSEWFGRMWVVQEIGVAETAGVANGGAVESWDKFLKAIHYLHYTLNIPIPNIRKLTALEKIRSGFISGSRQSLRGLIQECRYRQASDPRDKIYALLGLMGDAKNSLLTPDYEKSVSEVYAHTTQYFIQQSESLDPMCGWQTLGRDGHPSWVPDYNLNQVLAAAPLTPRDNYKSIFAASGYDERSKYTLDPSMTSKWATISVTGLCIDTVSFHSEPCDAKESLGSIEKFWQSTVLAATPVRNKVTSDVKICLENVSATIKGYSDYWDSLPPIHLNSARSTLLEELSLDDLTLNERLTRSEKCPIIPEFLDMYVVDAYIQSLLSGRQTAAKRLSKRDILILMSLQTSAILQKVPHSKTVNLICAALDAGMRKRNIAVTTNGYVGTMPEQVQQGDLVCVLFGCSVPVVLRKKFDNSYTFIGECYLHGFMDAEAIAMQVKGQLQKQDYILS